MSTNIYPYRVNHNFNSDCKVCKKPLRFGQEIMGHVAGKISHLFHKDCIRDHLKFNEGCPYGDKKINESGLLSLKDRIGRSARNLSSRVRDLTKEGINIVKNNVAGFLAGGLVGYILPTIGDWYAVSEEKMSARLFLTTFLTGISMFVNSEIWEPDEDKLQEKLDDEKFNKIDKQVNELTKYYEQEANGPVQSRRLHAKDQLGRLTSLSNKVKLVEVEADYIKPIGTAGNAVIAGTLAKALNAPELLIAPLVGPTLRYLSSKLEKTGRFPRLRSALNRVLSMESIVLLSGSAFCAGSTAKWFGCSLRGISAATGAAFGAVGSILSKTTLYEYLARQRRPKSPS